MSFVLLPPLNMDSVVKTARGIATKLLFILVTFPAVTGFVICLALSGMSFVELSRSLTNMQYESQQLGPASQPDRLRTSRCVDAAPSQQDLPSQVKVCVNETITEVPVNQLARELAGTLRTYYWTLVMFGLFVTILVQVGQTAFKRSAH